AICSALSLPSIGMAGRSRPATRRYSRLSSELPGTIAAPFSPPLSAPSSVRRSSLESCIASPWHFQQLFWKIGWTSLVKETGAWVPDKALDKKNMPVLKTSPRTNHAATVRLVTFPSTDGNNLTVVTFGDDTLTIRLCHRFSPK